MGRKEGPLRLAIKDFVETYVSPGIGGYFQRIAEDRRDELLEGYDKFLDVLGIKDAIPEALRPGSPVIALPALAAVIPALLGLFIGFGMQLAGAAIAPIGVTIALAVSKTVKHWRPDPTTLTALQNRFPGMSSIWDEIWDELGVPEDILGELPQILLPTVPEGDLITLWLRHDKDDSVLIPEMKARGWTDERIDVLKEVRQIIPGPQDLIQMAVREAFRDDIAERFKYDDDFPEDVVEWAERQGLSREWVKFYWRAHWDLPGVQAGYQMMHRLRPGTTENPFTLDDLETQLRTADIPSFFRDRLIEISFATFTRVDVRRMYKAGVLNEDQVYEAYLDLGYDKEKARALSDFAILDAGSEDRELTRTLITAGYERGTIPENEALDLLVSIGYTRDRAEFIIAIENADIEKKKVDEELDRVAFLYKEGEVDEPGVYAELGPLGLPSEQVANYIGKWDLQRRKSRALPAKGELEDWYKRDIITIEELELGFQNRRYVDDDIGRYILQLDQRIAEDATKEAERAQKEQERLALSEVVGEYQKEKSTLDLRIAEASLAIADKKLALHDVVDAEEKAQLKEEMDEMRVIIAERRVDKAQIRLELE